MSRLLKGRRKHMTVMVTPTYLCVCILIGYSSQPDWISILLRVHLVSVEWEQMLTGLAVCCPIVNADDLGGGGCGGGGCASCGGCGGGGCGGGCSTNCTTGGCSSCQY